MTTNVLQHAKYKLERAKHHIDLLNAADPFTTGKGFHFVADENNGQDKQVVRCVIDEPDLNLAVIIGEAIYQLRSTLDVATVSMAKHNSPNRSLRNTYFPFAEDEDNLKYPGTADEPGPYRKFWFLSSQAQQVIIDLKPYPGGNELLRTLNKLRNNDAHNNLISTYNFQYNSSLIGIKQIKGMMEQMFVGEVIGHISAKLAKSGKTIFEEDFDLLAMTSDASMILHLLDNGMNIGLYLSFDNAVPENYPIVNKLYDFHREVFKLLNDFEATL